MIAKIEINESGSTEQLIQVDVSMNIDAGWHTYASLPSGSTYVLTEINLELPDSVEVVSEIDRPNGVPYLPEPGSTVYEGTVVFQFTIRRPTEPVQLVSEIKFQACDDNKCNLPESTRIGLVVEAS